MNRRRVLVAAVVTAGIAAAALVGLTDGRLVQVGAALAIVALVATAVYLARQSGRVWNVVSRLHRGLAGQKNVPGTVGRTAVVVRRSDERLAHLEESVASLETLVRDTAGSAGRSAPIIRRIDERLARLVQDGDTASAPPIEKNDASATKKFERVAASKTNFPSRELKVAVIMDDFSLAAWDPEWLQYRLLPGTWSDAVETVAFDLLFVESAWQGNGGEWRYQLVGPNAPSEELISLVAAFRRRSIPTVFWNKEDPPHFDDFIKTAALFDWVMTSDSEKVPAYRRLLGHERVDVLPFAAQPALHNPVLRRGQQRDLPVAFGGMYFRSKYPERRAQMDFLLNGTASLGLDIYSRHAGANDEYAFPDSLAPFVRGALDYPEMIDAYKRYKVALNVNSVTDSPSMCARRIFEVTGCGGAIVTPPSAAIPNYFSSDEVTVARDAEEAFALTRGLLRSDEHRDRVAHRARRRVWAEHTYGHRLDALTAQLGIPMSERRTERPTVSVLCSTIRPHLIPSVFRTIASQTEPGVQLVLNLHGFDVDQDELEELARRHGVQDLSVLRNGREVSLGTCLNEMALAASGALVAKVDDDDYYGAHYLQDMVDSYLVSGADVVGKAASYIYFASREETVLSYRGHEQRFTDFVRGATLVLPRSLLLEHGFGDGNRSEDSILLDRVRGAGGAVFASDRFNYCVYRAAEGSEHTWQVSDASLFATGELVGFGDFAPLVEV